MNKTLQKQQNTIYIGYNRAAPTELLLQAATLNGAIRFLVNF